MNKRKKSNYIISILLGILYMGTLQASAASANEIKAESARSLFSDAMAVWHFADMNDSSGRNNVIVHGFS